MKPAENVWRSWSILAVCQCALGEDEGIPEPWLISSMGKHLLDEFQCGTVDWKCKLQNNLERLMGYSFQKFKWKTKAGGILGKQCVSTADQLNSRFLCNFSKEPTSCFSSPGEANKNSHLILLLSLVPEISILPTMVPKLIVFFGWQKKHPCQQKILRLPQFFDDTCRPFLNVPAVFLTST